MITKPLFRLSCALLGALGLASLPAHALDIKLGHVLAPAHSWHKAAEGFAAEVKDGPVIVGTISPGMVLTDLTMTQIRKDPQNNRQLIRIYNILANEADTVAPFLVKSMIDNTRNGAKISWLTGWKVIRRFLVAPFSKRDIVSKYL